MPRQVQKLIETYIGIGSNIGDRLHNINKAIEALSSFAKVGLVSSIYETEPEGFKYQPYFLNCVACIYTNMAPEKLLQTIKKIEIGMGRKRDFQNSPRIIDLDILLYGEQVIDQKGLQIPHPRMHKRTFVLIPLSEIAPDIIHPILHKKIIELKNEITNSTYIVKFK